jgi:GNAT superfamily N-acetyltransferase
MMYSGKPAHVHGPMSSSQLSVETWPDFENLFASNGGVWGGCWCMFFHRTGDFDAKAYERNKDAKESLAREGKAHGTIVYCGDQPVGWCQFGPRVELPRIDRKRKYVPTAPDPWRITCLFVAPGHRKSGVAKFAVRESVKYMKQLKAKVVEAYPVEGERSATLLWMGTPSLFEGTGFRKVSPFGKHSWIYSLSIPRGSTQK